MIDDDYHTTKHNVFLTLKSFDTVLNKIFVETEYYGNKILKKNNEPM